jgi:RNA polymerase sigma-70 factor, ECF subfamily
MIPSNEELMAHVSSGDRGAFALLYDRLSPRVFGLSLHFLGIHADAEDVLQETFLQVWDQAHRFEPARCTAAGWVLMIARSRALDRLRHRQRTVPGSLPDDLPSSNVVLGSDVDRQDSARPITDALNELPLDQREAICLAFYSGLTHEQIAARLGLPLGTVKTRIRLGMTRLRDKLIFRTKATDE